MNPETRHVLQFFAFAHLPPHLQEVSEPFHQLAGQIVEKAPHSLKTTVAVRKLLEAKDAAVRAVVEVTQDSASGETD